MQKQPINENELWEAVRRDEITAFNTLFDYYWDKLYKTAYRYLHDQEVCKEIVHDIFLNIWMRRRELEIHSFSKFLTAAVRYQVYNRRRTEKATVISVSDNLITDGNVSFNYGERNIEESELQNELNNYLKELPAKCQTIFKLSRIEHYSNDEIAVKLQISKRTVENQLTIALKHLRTHIKKTGVLILAIELFMLYKQ